MRTLALLVLLGLGVQAHAVETKLGFTCLDDTGVKIEANEAQTGEGLVLSGPVKIQTFDEFEAIPSEPFTFVDEEDRIELSFSSTAGDQVALQVVKDKATETRVAFKGSLSLETTEEHGGFIRHNMGLTCWKEILAP